MKSGWSMDKWAWGMEEKRERKLNALSRRNWNIRQNPNIIHSYFLSFLVGASAELLLSEETIFEFVGWEAAWELFITSSSWASCSRGSPLSSPRMGTSGKWWAETSNRKHPPKYTQWESQLCRPYWKTTPSQRTRMSRAKVATSLRTNWPVSDTLFLLYSNRKADQGS